VTARLRLALAALALGCGPTATPARGPEAAVPDRHTVRDAAAHSARPPAAADARQPAASEDEEAGGELRAEAHERDPRSEKVKLKLALTPAATGVVMWGRKKLADVKPGQMTVEVERVRDSGPLDVLVRADGFLPHHLRLFTDRDDRLSVRLIRPEEAHGLLGYRRPAAP
jgi:hypothetical protein